MAYGDENDFGWCNLFIKFALFVCNSILLLIGCILLAAGIFAQIEAGTLNQFGVGDVLANPAIILIIFGGVIFILGFTGSLGTLREVFILLVIYCIVMTVVVILEIGCGVYIYLQQEPAEQRFDEQIRDYIIRYYDNPDLQNIVDLVQQNLMCCGSQGPNDWEANIYFNCSSIAFQRCSVPFSCCNPGDDEEVVNSQCGYRTLDPESSRFQMDIYIQGCIMGLENFVQQYLYYIAGVGVGMLVFQLVVIMLTAGLAIDVKKERAALKNQRAIERKEKRFSRELDKI